MRYSTFDIPDLPLQAFQRHGRTIRPQGGGKGGGSKPDVPDYTAAAQATAQGNLDLAKYATQANRVNQVTPWGSITWTNSGAPQFNQSAYDQALAAYQQSLGGQGGSSGSSGFWDQRLDNDGRWESVWVPLGDKGGSSSSLKAPNPADFYTGGGADNWTQTVTLSPEMQALFNQQMQIQQGLFGAQNAALGRVNQTLGSGFNTAALPQGGDASALQVYDPTQATNNATDLILQRVNPELDRQQESLRAQLANQGISMGSAAYNTAMNQFQQGRNDATTQAALQGIGLGMQQQGQTFSQNFQKQQLADALRNSAFSQAAYERSLPLNELAALTTGQQVQMPQFPGYSQQATTAGPDYTGAANSQYAAQLGAYNAGQAQNQNFMGGLFGLAGTGLGAYFGGAGGAGLGGLLGGMFGGMFSDRRVKRHIKLIGKDTNGLNIYSYQYIWGGPTYIGYMAQEVEKLFPDAVGDFGGIKTVDYAKVA